jgi:hypothetical protein
MIRYPDRDRPALTGAAPGEAEAEIEVTAAMKAAGAEELAAFWPAEDDPYEAAAALYRIMETARRVRG